MAARDDRPWQPSTPAERQALLQSEIKRRGEVIRRAGIEPERPLVMA